MKQKRQMIFSLFILSFLLITGNAQANTTSVTNDVHSSANGSNANSSVSITNDVNTGDQNSSSTSTQSQTDIYMNTNGQVKEYHSDKPGSVSIQSDDGTSKVTIDNGNSTVNPTQSTKEGQMKEGKKKNATDEASIQKNKKTDQSNTLALFIQKQIEKIEDFFKNLKF